MFETDVFPEALVWRLVLTWFHQFTTRLFLLQIRALLGYRVLECLYDALLLSLDNI